MAKNSTRRVTIYINGKEVEAFVIFGIFRIFAPLKPLPMNRCRPYRLVHPLRGCGDTRGNAIYRDASPNGDKGRGNQYFGTRHVSATPPRWEDYGHTVFTASPPQCDGAKQLSILNSQLSTLPASMNISTFIKAMKSAPERVWNIHSTPMFKITNRANEK